MICYFLSFFYETKTLRFQNSFVKKSLKRVSLVEFDNLFNRDEILVIKNQSVQNWTEIAKSFKSSKDFTYNISSMVFSYEEKAWKDYGYIFERFETFLLIRKKYQQTNWVLIDSFDLYMLRKYYDVKKTYVPDLICRVTNLLNVFLGGVSSQFYPMVIICAQTAYLLKLLFFRIHKNVSGRILWNAVHSNEISHPLKASNALWIVNNTDLKNEDVIFMNPSKKLFLRESLPEGINYFYSVFQIIGTMHMRIRFKAFAFGLKNFFRSLPCLFYFSERIKLLQREQELYCWKIVIDRFNIKTSVDSVSESTNSNFRVLFFNQLKINTIFYLYSANSFFITSFNKHTLKHLSYSKILSNTIVVWHEKYKEILLRDYEIKGHIEVIGPLMANKEYLSTVDVIELRHKHIKQSNPQMTYVSVYDVSPQMKNVNEGTHSFFPAIYDPEFCSKFLIDIDRLFHENKNIVVIYKPKRNNKSKLSPIPDEMISILEKNAKDPRWINLDYDINPWIPIMMADINIGIPFTSTCFAALCKRKKILFHNPDQIAKFHEYDDIQGHISNNYLELSEKFLKLQSGMSLGDLEKSKYFVKEHKNGYSQAFADYLKKLSS